jgi:hypothetical protein
VAHEHDEAIVPPAPPGTPSAPKTPEPAAPVVDEAGFISLPPGMANFDSATYRMETPRRSEPAAPASPPVFVPTVAPGVPVLGLPTVTPVPSTVTPVPPAVTPVPSTVTPVPPATTPVPHGDAIDDATRVAPGRDAVDDATRVAPARRTAEWTLHIPGAEAHRLTAGTLLLGRGPAPLPAWPSAATLPLDDPKKSVSKTHAALELDASGRLVIHDLDSTNGVWLSYPNGDEVDVEPGAPATVEDGAVIHLGEFEIRAQRG